MRLDKKSRTFLSSKCQASAGSTVSHHKSSISKLTPGCRGDMASSMTAFKATASSISSCVIPFVKNIFFFLVLMCVYLLSA